MLPFVSLAPWTRMKAAAVPVACYGVPTISRLYQAGYILWYKKLHRRLVPSVDFRRCEPSFVIVTFPREHFPHKAKECSGRWPPRRAFCEEQRSGNSSSSLPPLLFFLSFFLSFFLFFFFFFLERVCGSENVLRIVLLFEHNRHRDDTAYK